MKFDAIWYDEFLCSIVEFIMIAEHCIAMQSNAVQAKKSKMLSTM